MKQKNMPSVSEVTMKLLAKIHKIGPALAVSALALWIVSVRSPAEAHNGVVLSAFGTATVDGVLSPGEWDNADSINFLANLPPNDGGGTTPATLFVMNDGTNLYLAVRVARSSFGGATNPAFEFDNNHNGVREDGDDVFGLFVGTFSPATFLDGFRFTCPGAAPGSAGCSALDTASTVGFPSPGTSDGATAATNDGTFTVVELSHPLNGTDDAHDFSLSPGSTVGFTLFLQLFSVTPACNFGPACFADTGFPTACPSCANLFGDIVIAAPVIRVAIDIKPGSSSNNIDLRSAGVVPVAILSSPTFDATQVNPETVSLAGAKVRLIGKGDRYSCSPQDVTGDGLADLVCHVMTAELLIEPGDSIAVLEAETFDGKHIKGEDSIRITSTKAPAGKNDIRGKRVGNF